MNGTETEVLRNLSVAMDALKSAAVATKDGFTADYCGNAMREIRSAMRIAIGGEYE